MIRTVLPPNNDTVSLSRNFNEVKGHVLHPGQESVSGQTHYLMKSRMKVTSNFLGLFTKEVLMQFVKETEKGDGSTAHCSCCMPGEQTTLGSWLAETPARGSSGDTVSCVSMASHMG